MNRKNLKEKKAIMLILSLLIIISITTLGVFAEGLLDSKLVNGTKQLLTDAMTALAVICPIAGGVGFGICMGRKTAAEEQDQALWKKRATQAIIAGVGGCLGSSIVAIASHYYL